MGAEDYLALIKSLIALCPVAVEFNILREDVQGDRGLWRYRLTLQDKSFVEMFEFFEIQSDRVKVIKYSFHWQKDNYMMVLKMLYSLINQLVLRSFCKSFLNKSAKIPSKSFFPFSFLLFP
jgi:hypothetical protein